MSTTPAGGIRAIDELGTVRVYDRETLEECLADIETERDRLRASLRAAEERRDALVASHPSSVTEQLGTIVLDAQAQLTAEWDACRQDEAALEEATEAVASWIVVGARSHAASLRAVTAQIQATGADAVPDVAGQWWEGVIDLTTTDPAQSVHTS